MSVYAQEYGYFFNSTNHDRTYSAESFETWLKPFFVSGVFAGGLQVHAKDDPDMSVVVSAGYANINGKPAHWPEENILQLSTASGVYSRIDTIVLRRDNTNRAISIEVITGTASANPQPKAPTRNNDIYELVLAEILVGVGVTEITAAKITDKRPDSSVCGYVAATVEEMDFDQFAEQFNGWAEEFKAQMEEDYAEYVAQLTEYIEELEEIIDTGSVASLQRQVDQIINQIDLKKGLQSAVADPTASGTASEFIDSITQDAQGVITPHKAALPVTGGEGLAIIVNGDVAPQNITSGQYLFIKNHSTLAAGGYHATAAISSGETISNSNVTADADGIANALNSNLTGDTNWITLSTTYPSYYRKVAGIVTVTVRLIGGATPTDGQLLGTLPEGYRPAVLIVSCSHNSRGAFSIDGSGAVKANAIAGQTLNNYMGCCVSYPV